MIDQYWNEIITVGVPVVVFLGILLIGLTLRRILFSRLSKWAAKTAWHGDDIILQSIRGPFLLWCLLIAIHISTGISQLPDDWSVMVGRAMSGLLILSISWVAANTISRLIAMYASRLDVVWPMTSLTQNVVRVVILGLGLLIFLDTIGVEITSLLAALGIGSLAVALGLQPTLTNLFAGVHILVNKNIRIGDYIKLDSGEEGYVLDINWRSTRVRNLPNHVIIIPNAKLLEAMVTNYDLPDQEIALLVQVGVDYASDLAHVERVTIDVARDVQRSVPGAVPTFEPFIRYHTFADFSINFTVILRVKTFVDQYLVKHEFVKRLHTRYNREGITIPFPIRTLYVKSETPTHVGQDAATGTREG